MTRRWLGRSTARPAELALRGALDLIGEAPGGFVEGYPHVPGEKKMSSSFLCNGTRAMYEHCGFDFVRPEGLKNTVMRRTVAPSGWTTAEPLGRAA